MDNLTNTILKKLKFTIALRFLHSEENIKRIYQEIARAKTPGMLLEAIKKLPVEEIQSIQKVLRGQEDKSKFYKNMYSKLVEIPKYNAPPFSFKFSEGNFKRRQRLETLNKIRKRKNANRS